MEFLAKKVHKEIQVPCFTPANGETIKISCAPTIQIKADSNFIKKAMEGHLNNATLHAAIVHQGSIKNFRKFFEKVFDIFVKACNPQGKQDGVDLNY